MKRVLLVGAGHAQLAVLTALARRRLPGAEVVLVSASERQVYSGMVPGLIAGRCSLDDCSIAIAPLAAAAAVRFVRGRAVALDAAAQAVTLADGQCIEYDVLALNTGPTQDRERLPGARDSALFVRPIEDFAALWQRTRALAEERALDVVVIGSGAAGVEIALAVRHALDRRGEVTLVSDGPVLASYPLHGHRAVARGAGHAAGGLRRSDRRHRQRSTGLAGRQRPGAGRRGLCARRRHIAERQPCQRLRRRRPDRS
jgi:NADH dehydrogenase FAD-containing subunit